MLVSRRRLLQTALANLALPASGASQALAGALAAGRGTVPTLPAVVDLASDSTPILGELRRRGVRTLCRYYALRPEPERGLPDKIIRPTEAAAIFDAGFSLLTVFQYYSHQLANMTAERGRRDAETALEQAANVIGQPSGSAIYFAADNNWFRADELRRVGAYMTAVNDVFSGAGHLYRIGIYGAGRTCRFLREEGLAELFWLAKSTCWSETVECYNGDNWHLYQSKHNIPIDRTLVDFNLVNPRHEDFGQFRPDDRPVAHAPAHSRQVLASLAFIAAPTVLARRPGGSGRIRRLDVADTVRIVAREGNWLLVDVDEDGVGEGYIPASAIDSPRQMPRRC